MTTFAKVWGKDQNRVPVQTSNAEQGKWITWYLKAFLKGEVGGMTGSGLWTCVGSSDSFTAGMDSVDRWGSSYDTTKIIANVAPAVHSWIVLKSPTALGNYYLIIDKPNNQYEFWVVTFSKTLPTGGTTGLRPTAPDEFGLTSFLSLIDGTGAACHVHGFLAADGTFMVLVSKDGTGFYSAGIELHEPLETKAGDAHKCFAKIAYNSSSPGIMNAPALHQGTNLYGRTKDNTAASQYYVMSYVFGSSIDCLVDCTAVDPTDGNYCAMHAYLYSRDPSGHSIRGRFADMLLGPTTAPALTVEPASGAVQSQLIGGTWMPSDVVPSL